MPTNKSDTVLRLEVGTSQTADLSQFGQTLTSSGGGGYLDPSANTAIDGSGRGREISFSFSSNSTDTGTLIYHGSTGGTVGYRVKMAAGGQMTFTQSGGDVITATLPDVDGFVRLYECSICTRPNPLTTGASDAMITEVYMPRSMLVAPFSTRCI